MDESFRISMPDLSEGFVVQTLKNDFISNETTTLTSLLRILGKVEYPIFVTFHNSIDSSDTLVDNRSHEIITDESAKKIIEMDEMSLSEFDILSEEDKDLYREKILVPRSQESLRRRIAFQQRITELRNKTSGSRNLKQFKRSRVSTDKSSKLEVSNKNKKIEADSANSTARKSIIFLCKFNTNANDKIFKNIKNG